MAQCKICKREVGCGCNLTNGVCSSCRLMTALKGIEPTPPPPPLTT